jgi:hypothetical protein
VKRILARYQVKGYRRFRILAVDFENEPETGKFICAGVYGDTKTGAVDKYFKDQGACLEYLAGLRKSACLIVTYNLAYDRVFLDDIIDQETVIGSGSRIISLYLKNGIRVIDLKNHVDGELKDWINHLDMTNRWKIKKHDLKQHRSRVINDAKATYYLGAALQEFYNYQCGISLQPTVSSAALKVFAKRHLFDCWQSEDDTLREFERLAYYGGRCELFKRGRIKTWSYDVNSMYISVMQREVMPDPISATWFNGSNLSTNDIYGNLGIWHCRVKAPDNLYLPVLPVRIDGKLKFPLGEFSGVWCNIELIEAILNGYEIVEIYKAVVYTRQKDYFRSFADFIWRKRNDYKEAGNKGMEMMIKKLGNSLHGKLAQRNRQRYFGKVEDYGSQIDDGTRIFDYKGKLWMEHLGDYEPAIFQFPCLSAFVTAYARLKLYRAMVVNQDILIYCDTDSMKLSARGSVIVNDQLGGWSRDQAGVMVEYYRPKLYGNVHKGVPDHAKVTERQPDKTIYVWDKPLRYNEAIRKGKIPNSWIQATKVLLHDDDKRNWQGDQSTPLVVTENT